MSIAKFLSFYFTIVFLVIFITIMINFILKRNKIYYAVKSNKKCSKVFSSLKISEILEKVKYNPLITYTKKINTNLIESTGIKLDMPVYIENYENLSLSYIKSLWLAKKIYNFNLIIFYNKKNFNSKCCNYEILKLFFKQNAKFLNSNEVTKEIKENLYKLNINYNFSKKIEQKKTTKQNTKFLKKWHIGNENEIYISKDFVKNSTFKNFYKSSILTNETIKIKINQTFFNGEYCFFELKKNLKNDECYKKENFELHFNKIIYCLTLDYFKVFKKNNYFLIKSLLGKTNFYFYCSIKIKSIYISKILHSKNYCLKCIFKFNSDYFKQNLNYFWIYFGKNLPNNFLNCNYNELFLKISYCLKSIFNVKIKTEDTRLNFYFNNYLPKKIILDGIENQSLVENCKISLLEKEYSENEFLLFLNNFSIRELINFYKEKKLSTFLTYTLIKSKLIVQKNDSFYINKNELANYELKIFVENKFKKIKILSGNKRKIIIDNLIYQNCRNISNKALLSNENFQAYI